MAPIAVFAITFLVFAVTIGHQFVDLDDNIHVTANPRLKPPSWSHVADFWRAPYLNLYIPLSYTLFSAEAWVSGGIEGSNQFDPRIFHAVSVTMHATSTTIVYLLFRTMGLSTLGAFLGSLFFGIHPLQVESVAWVTEQRGLLAGLWSIAALVAYVRHVAAGAVATTVGWWIAATLFALLGLLSKPSAVAVVPMALVLDLAWFRRSLGRVAIAITPWVLLSISLLFVTKGEQSTDIAWIETPAWSRPLVAADAFTFYLIKLVWPAGLGPDHGRPPDELLTGASIYLTWLVPIGLVIALVATRRPLKWWAPLGLFVAGLTPTLGFVPFHFQHISTVADRYAYLALIGPALALAMLVQRWNGGRVVLPIALALLALAGLSIRQSLIWRDSMTLLAQGLLLHPSSVTLRQVLAVTLSNAGRPDDAIAQLQEAVRAKPSSARAHYLLGVGYYARRDLARSVDSLRQAIALQPLHADAQFALGLAQLGLNKPAEAKTALEAAVRSRPKFAEAHEKLAVIAYKQGRMDDAVRHYRDYVRLKPDDAEKLSALGLILSTQGNPEGKLLTSRAAALAPDSPSCRNNHGHVLLQQNRYADAAIEFEAALRQDPDNADAHNNLGIAWTAIGRPDDAIKEFRAALALRPEDARTRSNLGLLLANKGLMDEAMTQLEGAVRSNPLSGDSHAILAEVLARQNKVERARDHYQQAVRLTPNNAVVHNKFGLLLLRLRQPDLARREFAEAVRLQPDFAEAVRNLNGLNSSTP